MPCDRINFPAILRLALRNQLALAELLAERGVVDFTRRRKLVEAAKANLAEFDEFIAGYTLTIRKRAATPRKCV